MDITQLPFGEVSGSSQICRARVRELVAEGLVIVEEEREGGDSIVAEQLQVADGASLQLERDDIVLIWRPTQDERRAILLGRLGVPRRSSEKASADHQPPETLLLEAKHELTLRVGDGSITIREDGKILIKGKDLVSHAQRMNRIKGGAVSIN